MSQYACVIKTYLVWLKDGGQARWWRVNMQPHQMLISPRDRPLTTHSSCYWHTEWEESVLSYKNIKNPTKACGCRLYFHVKRLLTYLKKLCFVFCLCFTEKTPTTPFYSSYVRWYVLMISERDGSGFLSTVSRLSGTDKRVKALNYKNKLYLFIMYFRVRKIQW